MRFCLPLPVSFEFIKLSIKYVLVFVRKLMFFKYSCQKSMKFFFERPVFLEEFQTEINFSKVSLHFNKIPNSLRQVLQTYYRHIQKYALFVHHKKKVLQKQSVKINLKEPGQFCGKSDGDVMKFIL